jgi:hypothetical protein
MLRTGPVLRRVGAAAIIAILVTAVVTVPAWCVATGLWW